jgi:hypothetical protein
MCSLNKELAPYEEQKRLDVPWIEIGLFILVVFYIQMSQDNQVHPLVDTYREELEMARQHAAVLERDLEQYKQLVAELSEKKNTEELDDLILSALFENKEGLTVKMLMIMLKPILHDIKKTDINKRLYTMFKNKVLRKSEDKAPVWTLSA